MIEVQAGRGFDAVLEGAATGLVGTIGVRVIDPATQTTVVARQTTGISEFPAGSGVYGVALTAPAIGTHASPWQLSVMWDIVAGGSPLTPANTFTDDLYVYSAPPPRIATVGRFATVGDIAARLGRSLTTAESAQADSLLTFATDLIADAADKGPDWSNTLDPVPSPLHLTCIEVVSRVLQNPSGAASTQETLGSYSYSQRYAAQAASGLELTDAEVLRIRRAVYGRNSASPRVPTLANHIGRRWMWDDSIFIAEHDIDS